MEYVIFAGLLYVAWMLTKTLDGLEKSRREVSLLGEKLFELKRALEPVIEKASNERLAEALHNLGRQDREAAEVGEGSQPDPAEIRRVVEGKPPK